MKPRLRSYLESLGLREDADKLTAWKYMDKLDPEQNQQARAIQRGQAPEPTNGTGGDGQRGDGQRNSVDPEEAIKQERKRVSQLRSLFNGDAPEIMERAIDEGWTPEEAAPELLKVLRKRQSTPVEGGGPAIHSRGSDDVTTEALQGALFLATAQPLGGTRGRPTLDNPAFRSDEARAMSLPDWLRADVDSDQFQQTAERAHKLRSLNSVDMIREVMRASGNHRVIPHDYDEMIRAAISSGDLTGVYTTSVNARLLASYIEQTDTTVGWTSEAEVVNFKTNERTTMGKTGRLKRHSRGGTADHGDISDSKEEYKIARYSQQIVFDEMDIIDDNFGALTDTTPEEMGAAARQLRADLVYSILIENANLGATGAALFTSGQNNLFTGGTSALDIPALETALVNMADQRIRNRPINLMGRYLIVNPSLKFLAKRMVQSAEVRNPAQSANQREGIANVLTDEGLTVVSDSRLSATGVIDPTDDTVRTGSATIWFLTARPGENGAKTIEVGFRRGTGRAPQVRSFELTQGQWGIGFDIKMDIGAKALDYRAMQRHDGA